MDNNLRDDNPAQPGWYATLMCWDVEEEVFPGGCYWNGETWDTNASVQYWPIVFGSQEAAETYAYNNDPER
jgi:hypothetical protein